MKFLRYVIPATGLAALAASTAIAQDAGMKKWVKGTGWGWVWGGQDEVGNLNEMTDASRLAALQLVRQGKAYDLGLPYDRNSYKWPGHSPGEIISFRSPHGVKNQQDLPFTTPEGGNTGGTAWHSTAIFMNDNVATQIDGWGTSRMALTITSMMGLRPRSGAATLVCARRMSRPSRRSSRAAC